MCGPRRHRQRAKAFSSLSTFLLNVALFVLVGLEVPAAVRGLTSVAIVRGLIDVVAVSAVIIAVRFGWLFTTVYLVRILDRRLTTCATSSVRRLRAGIIIYWSDGTKLMTAH
jgi:NhaP-type Na+/H+ or K+/H+ antiporter